MSEVKYRIYATILDSFQGYLSSSEIYDSYWGFSEDLSKTEEEFEKEQFESLINRINRVPMKWEDSEAADKGTAFNEVVDCLIANRKSEKMIINKVYKTKMYGQVNNCDSGERYADIEQTNKVIAINVNYNKRTFVFPITLIREFAEYFKGGTSQVFTEGILSTKYGDVLLYGYIDELSPLVIHDIKTTGKYKVGKFRNNWQHVVYPFCLNQQGNPVNDFEYNVAVLGSGVSYSTFTEYYRYVPERDINRLQIVVESFIDFLELNRNLIIDKKIFNYVTN